MTAREEADELLRRAQHDVDARLAEIRDEALEEAARVCDEQAQLLSNCGKYAEIAAKRIRALKSQEAK